MACWRGRRSFLLRCGALAAVAGLPWLGACAPARPLVVAIHPWVGYETLYLAREFHWLPAGVQLHGGRSLSDSFAALQSGVADAACLTLDEILRARSLGLPLSVAWVFNVSAGADAVVARPDIAAPADLAGRRLGYEPNALGALILRRLLEVAGLPASALVLLDLPPDQQVAAWNEDRVDAVITYEPVATLLRHQGARTIFDSRELPDTIFDLFTVRRDRVTDLRLVRALAASHFRGLDHLRILREDAIFRIAAREGMSLEETRQTLAGVVLPSLAANRGYLVGPENRLARAAAGLAALMVQLGLVPRAGDLTDLILPGMLPDDAT